ncbi:MAG: TIGR03862 family flavoprotein, partial [Rhizomicrobium sp.]
MSRLSETTPTPPFNQCDSARHVAVIGAGPAGLIAADYISARGIAVTVYEHMSSPARKFLMAGRGGLNLTHAEPFADFLSRYGADAPWLEPYLSAFGPAELQAWADGLGVATFVGSSGRVFPQGMKASPLLRAWLKRLGTQAVVLRTGYDWCGWDGEMLKFTTSGGPVTVKADACLLALGGASWPKLGTTGSWAEILRRYGVGVVPFRPANCGFLTNWSERFSAYAGEPLKNVGLRIGDLTVRGEAVIASYG